jgi:hypothetical protein
MQPHQDEPKLDDDGKVIPIKEAEKYWQRRKKHGRDKAISTPDVLWEYACDYFQRCDDTPWVKTDYKGKFVEKVAIPTQRPYTWGGLDDFLNEKGVLVKLEDYKANKPHKDTGKRPYDDYSDVIARIGNIIRTQKLEGAMVGAFDARIVSAELSLTQKVEVSTPKQIFKIGDKEIEIG